MDLVRIAHLTHIAALIGLASLRAKFKSSITIPDDKPPALLEDSQCFTYAEDVPKCFECSNDGE
jgi:hypothetical protein